MQTMADIYVQDPEALARFYAERMSEGFGAAVERKLAWTLRDAAAAGDRRRQRFWQQVLTAAKSGRGADG
jgi:hypothetical protein